MTTPYIISTPPPKVGFVATFIGGGTTSGGTNPGDPNGWVICDGQPRTVTDERYAAIAPFLNTYLSVNTNNANSITPPDYRKRFLEGQETGSQIGMTLGGTGSVKLIADQIPTLPTGSFTYNDPKHSHGFNFYRTDGGRIDAKALLTTNSNPPANTTTTASGNSATQSATYVNNSQTTINILPPYFSLNYIIKY